MAKTELETTRASLARLEQSLAVERRALEDFEGEYKTKDAERVEQIKSGDLKRIQSAESARATLERLQNAMQAKRENVSLLEQEVERLQGEVATREAEQEHHALDRLQAEVLEAQNHLKEVVGDSLHKIDLQRADLEQRYEQLQSRWRRARNPNGEHNTLRKMKSLNYIIGSALASLRQFPQ